MKATQISGRRVVDVPSARELGSVTDLMVDLQAHRITDLVLRRGLFGDGIIPSEAIEAVGRDAITVDCTRAGAEPSQGHPGAQRLSRLRGIAVLSEDGTRLGALQDIEFDPASLEIGGYLYTHGGFAGLLAEQRLLPRDRVKRAGPDLVIAAREEAADVTARPGVRR